MDQRDYQADKGENKSNQIKLQEVNRLFPTYYSHRNHPKFPDRILQGRR